MERQGEVFFSMGHGGGTSLNVTSGGGGFLYVSLADGAATLCSQPVSHNKMQVSLDNTLTLNHFFTIF